MNKLDKILLDVYLLGFSDELDEINNEKYIKEAYFLGRTHAIVGDDISTIDLQTDDQILNQIKKPI